MATYAPDTLEWLADQWEAAIPSAVCSGIVGDAAHKQKPSKHNSRQDNPSGSWATSHKKDQSGPSNMACALDMSMSTADMKKVHGRFVTLYKNRNSDPRAEYIDCFNGWDGSGSAERFDLPAGTISNTDDSHKWHEHTEEFYCYVGTDDTSWTAAHAQLSVVRGEGPDDWDEDMPSASEIAEETRKAIMSDSGMKQLLQRAEGLVSLREDITLNPGSSPVKLQDNELRDRLDKIDTTLAEIKAALSG